MISIFNQNVGNLLAWDYFDFEFNSPQWAYFEKRNYKNHFNNKYDYDSVGDYWHFMYH